MAQEAAVIVKIANNFDPRPNIFAFILRFSLDSDRLKGKYTLVAPPAQPQVSLQAQALAQTQDSPQVQASEQTQFKSRAESCCAITVDHFGGREESEN